MTEEVKKPKSKRRKKYPPLCRCGTCDGCREGLALLALGDSAAKVAIDRLALEAAKAGIQTVAGLARHCRISKNALRRIMRRGRLGVGEYVRMMHVFGYEVEVVTRKRESEGEGKR